MKSKKRVIFIKKKSFDCRIECKVQPFTTLIPRATQITEPGTVRWSMETVKTTLFYMNLFQLNDNLIQRVWTFDRRKLTGMIFNNMK